MAMGTCRECKNQVSTEADKCPHCGVSMPTGASLAKKIAGGAVAGVVMLIAIGMCNGPSTSTNSSTPSTFATTATAPSRPAAKPAIAVDAMTLFNAYQANEVAADDEYKGRTLLVTGTVSEISKDLFDNVVVNLRSGNQFMSVHATMEDSMKSAAARLAKGRQVTVRCEGGGMIVGSPMLKDCTFAP